MQVGHQLKSLIAAGEVPRSILAGESRLQKQRIVSFFFHTWNWKKNHTHTKKNAKQQLILSLLQLITEQLGCSSRLCSSSTKSEGKMQHSWDLSWGGLSHLPKACVRRQAAEGQVLGRNYFTSSVLLQHEIFLAINQLWLVYCGCLG